MSTITTVKDQKFTQHPHNIRNASGRFRKVEAIETRKETKIKRLHEGFKTWNAKRKLQYDNVSKENEPPAKRMTRACEVSTFLFIRKSYNFGKIFLPSSSSYRPTYSVDSNPDSHQQNKAKRKANLPRGSRLVDIETLTEGLKECSVCHFGKYSLFFIALYHILSISKMFVFLKFWRVYFVLSFF